MNYKNQMTTIIMLSFSLFLFTPLIADINESEPNDPCGTGIETNKITKNEIYKGSVYSGTDTYDYWYINSGSSGEVTLNVQNDFWSTLNLYECDTDYCTDCTSKLIIDGGGTNSYTLNAAKYYYLSIRQTGGGPAGGNYSITVSGDAALPVSLTSFTASAVESWILLEWTTASETDVLGFVLDVQLKGTDEWREIAGYTTHKTLKSKGNTTTRTTYGFTDNNVEPGRTYIYRLSEVDVTGKITVLDTQEATALTIEKRPISTNLEPAYPNPFNPQTRIVYNLAEETRVNLRIVDINGRTIKHIIRDNHQPAGQYNVYWNGKDDSGNPVPSAMYMIALHAGPIIKTQKVILVR